VSRGGESAAQLKDHKRKQERKKIGFGNGQNLEKGNRKGRSIKRRKKQLRVGDGLSHRIGKSDGGETGYTKSAGWTKKEGGTVFRTLAKRDIPKDHPGLRKTGKEVGGFGRCIKIK